MRNEKIVEWFLSRDTGTSSEAIVAVMTGFPTQDALHMLPPSDPDDMGRCLRLLEIFPEWKSRLNEMKEFKFGWAKLIARWEEISSCMEEEVGIKWEKGDSAPKTYKLMKKIMEDEE